MRIMLLSALAVGTAIAATPTPVEARQGCGIGFHRGAYGRCIANRRGVFYRGHGWWDGRRYWQRRYRYRGHWRYR